MNAPEPRINVPAIGAQLAGGTCLGHVFVNGNPFALIVPPKAVREHEPTVWNGALKRVAGATSYFDGWSNTLAMADAGSEIAQWALAQRIEGFGDWFIPSRNDALVICGNVSQAGTQYKPGATEAFETSGWYWTSTQNEAYDSYAFVQDFGYGYQSSYHKSNEHRAFLVRREPIR